MDKNVLVLLAPGFEEMEAVISIDLLRRAGCAVTIAAVASEVLVKGSRGIFLRADILLKDNKFLPDALVLPGGMPGARNLADSAEVIRLIQDTFKNNKIVAAICAAPAFVLAKAGILSGRRATCYPGEENRFPKDVLFKDAPVVVDGNLITSQGPGTGFAFALALIEKLCSAEAAASVKAKALIG